MPAAVAVELDLEPRRAPVHQLALRLFGKRARKARSERPGDARLIHGTRRDQDLAPRLPVPLADQRAQAKRRRQRRLGVASRDRQNRHVDVRRQRGTNELPLKRRHLQATARIRPLGNREPFGKTDGRSARDHLRHTARRDEPAPRSDTPPRPQALAPLRARSFCRTIIVTPSLEAPTALARGQRRRSRSSRPCRVLRSCRPALARR